MAIDAGTVVVTVVPNTSGFTSKLTGLISGVGKTLEKAGISATTAAVGVGIGVAAVAATKAALSFEEAFTKIDAVSNASAESIAQWRGEVLQLAGETAQSPQELADALYFLASAGLEAGTEMDVLEQSAKASAIGLGDTAVVARLNAQALNAYADSGLTATEATDTLVAAVQEGTAEPEEFAESLGRVLPIASRAGVAYEEVAASLASLSNIGLDVSIGTTALRGLLSALVAPGTEAAQTLAEVGISTQDLRDVLSEGGLLKALQLLEQRTGGNIDVLKKIVPNIRALTAELGLTGENAEHVQVVFDNVIASQGAAADAFATTAEGPMFQFNQVMAEAQVLLIEFGEAVLPLAQNVASVLGPALSALGGFISGNADLIRNLILAFLGFKAVAFVPVLLRAISLSLVSLEVSTLVGIANGFYAIAGGLTAIGATGSAASVTNIANKLPLLAGAFKGLGGALGAFTVAGVGAVALFDSLSVSAASLSKDFGISSQLSTSIHDITTGFSGGDWLHFFGDPIVRSGSIAKEFGQTVANLSAEGQHMGLTFEETDSILTSHIDLLNRNRESQIGFTDAVREGFSDKIRANTKLTLQGILDYSQGIVGLSVAGDYVTTVYDQFGTTLLDNTKLTYGQKAAVAGQIQQIYDLGGSLDYAETKWLEQNEAAGNFETITDRLNKDIAKLSDDAGKTLPKSLEQITAGVTNFSEAIGTDFQTVSADVFDAWLKDGRQFGDNFNEVVSDLEDDWLELQSTFQEGLGGFGSAALDELLSKTNLTTQGVIDSFHEARKETQQFGNDLLTIAKSGGQAGEDLASTLAAAGPDAANFADFIASASKKGRDEMIAAFGSQETAASRLATRLTTTIAGALQNIRGLLHDLVREHFNIRADLDDRATPKITALETRLQRLQQTTYTVNIQVIQGGSIPDPGGPAGPHPSEFGSYLPGAARGGWVTRPQLLNVGEHHKAEMILPLENKQGVNALARAMGQAARSLDGGKVRGGDGGTAKLVISGPVKLQVGKTSMDAYISGVARAEDDKQSRYDERLSRMRRD